MSYSLVDSGERTEDPLTEESFLQKLKNHYSIPEKKSQLSDETCMLCATHLVDCRIGKRKCLRTHFPCEGKICSCTSFPACIQCMASHLWKSSNEVMRRDGRFRAKCPFCKAEYCHLDVVVFKLQG
eukprot:TRINITY_DN2052_c0_g1_i1.p1 TRINITY_DN2052_c0_g1~~TRINITY_DN2052_c0_g1_i1.p1  ORF type:complete len:126 (-),score=13.78 TRINITY_DN2052_c0_g1_i1:210-587(-)